MTIEDSLDLDAIDPVDAAELIGREARSVGGSDVAGEVEHERLGTRLSERRDGVMAAEDTHLGPTTVIDLRDDADSSGFSPGMSARDLGIEPTMPVVREPSMRVVRAGRVPRRRRLRRRPTVGQVVALFFALVPWSWYAVRDLDPRLDVVAMVWPAVGVLLSTLWCLVTLAVRRRTLLVITLSWTLCTAAVVVAPWRPLDSGTVHLGGGLRIASANILGQLNDAPDVLRQIEGQHPDVLVVSELPWNPTRYEHAFRYASDQGRYPDVGVFANVPVHDLGLPPALAGQHGRRVRIDGPDGPFVLYAMHLQKPGPNASNVEVGIRTYRRIIDSLVASVRAERLPVVVAGDLNLVDRTSGYRAMTGVLDDGMRAGWVGPTSIKKATRFLLARIDHVFAPSSWCSDVAHTFTLQGSDHRGVVTTIGVCG